MPNGVVMDVNWFRGSAADLTHLGALGGSMSKGDANDASGSLNATGPLLTAFIARQTEGILWTEVTLGDLVITVASDAMKAAVGDRRGVRLPVSYQEAVFICAALGCVAPTKAMCDAMFAQAKAQLSFVGFRKTAARMIMDDFVLEFAEGVEKQLAGLDLSPGDLVFGAWKLWILHRRLVEKGAVNYGFWDKHKHPPAPIQTVGGRHDAMYHDYSQLLQPVKRGARKTTGEPVDLLDYIAAHDHVPARYLDPYRKTPPPWPKKEVSHPIRGPV